MVMNQCGKKTRGSAKVQEVLDETQQLSTLLRVRRSWKQRDGINYENQGFA